MKVNSTVSFGNFGSIDLVGENVKMTINLTPEEAARIMSVAQEIFEERQAKIVEEVARPAPHLAHFTEVHDA